MPVMSLVERLFCCSTLWRVTSRASAGTLLADDLGTNVLEIGAGSGAVAERLLSGDPDLKLIVADLDPHMVACADRRLSRFPRATATLADATDLPFADSSFDAVISCLMLHHVQQWEQSLAEVSRVLRPGGRFVGYDLVRSPFAVLLHALDRSPYHLIRPDELAAACQRLGLRADVRTRLAGQLMIFRATTPS